MTLWRRWTIFERFFSPKESLQRATRIAGTFILTKFYRIALSLVFVKKFLLQLNLNKLILIQINCNRSKIIFQIYIYSKNIQ